MHVQRIKVNLVVVGLVLTGFLLTTIIGRANPATDGLVGYQPLDEGKEKAVTDISDNKLNGKLTGNPKRVDDKIWKGPRIRWQKEHVIVANDDKLDFTKKLTFIALWLSSTRLRS